jgi:hypothetical protein
MQGGVFRRVSSAARHSYYSTKTAGSIHLATIDGAVRRLTGASGGVAHEQEDFTVIESEQKRRAKLRVFLRVYGVSTIIIFGSLSLGFIVQTPLLSENHGALHWTIWDDVTGHVGPMLFVIYLTWAVFFFLAARHPESYLSFLDFTMWANLAHGALMAIQTLPMMGRMWTKWITDIPFVLLLSLGIFLWRPRLNRSELPA